MISTLAEVAPPPAGVQAWLETFFWLAAGVLTCVVLFQKLTGKGDRQLLEVHGRIKRERGELDAQIKEVKDAQKLLDDKLDKELKELRDEIIAMPERVIELLVKIKQWSK
jgi:hypothetical protein